MAMVTCPKCKRVVSNSAKKCPNCGNALSGSPFDMNAPKYAKLHLLSNIVLGASFILLFIEFVGMAKTYVGGLLFGAGFMLQGFSQLEKEKLKGYDGKKRGKLIIGISVVVSILGALFLYWDLI